jgi:hypothetical protein
MGVERWPFAKFLQAANQKRRTYENAKPQQALYSPNPAVRHNRRIECSGTTGQEFERFIRSINPQLRNPLPTRIYPYVQRTRMFLRETLTVKPGLE